MKKTALALALALGLGAAGLVVAQPSVAEARSGISFGIHIGSRPHVGLFFGPRVFFGPRYYQRRPIFVAAPCHWLKVKALRTGSRYWYGRWQQCRYNRLVY